MNLASLSASYLRARPLHTALSLILLSLGVATIVLLLLVVGQLEERMSRDARGIDLVNTGYNYLDLAPKGRDENGRSQFWVRRHDEYQR